jgi:hypothetical protein
MKSFIISLCFNTKEITQLPKIFKIKFYLQVVNERMNDRKVGSSDNYIIYIDQQKKLMY